jgi:sulfur-oxidizing protein SoxA
MRHRPATLFGLALAATMMFGLPYAARPATDPALAPYSVGTEKSGFLYASPQTRAMETDDFNNPGFLAVDRGKTLWNTVVGTEGKSCASCHNAAETSMKGVGATYPKVDAKTGALVDMEERINLERARMGAPPLAWESDDLIALTTYVKLQSRGMPVNVATNGAAHPYWVEGKHFYESRRGQLDMSCEQCHGQNNNNLLRTEVLSQGQINGFPTYRLAWQGMGSAQRRFRECNQQIRAEPLAYGSPEYNALELYVASRGNGLPVETPSVRK